MDPNEKEINRLIEQMNRQQNIGRPINLNQITDNFGGTDQSPHLLGRRGMNSVDQTPQDAVNSVRPMGKSIFKEKTSVSPMNSQIPESIPGACPQCGILHPPVAPGSKCPMAPLKVAGVNGEKIVDVNKFLVNLKDIIISQSEFKKIKDVEKLFKNIIVEITKYLERYTE